MNSLKASNISQTKRCQSYVKKLHKQIQLIGDQVKFFNMREQKNVKKNQRINLKSLSQPKWQHIILQNKFNPQHPKIQNNTKISKLFKNCSTISQSDFIYASPSMLFGAQNSKIINLANSNTSKTQKMLNKKLRVLEQSWNKINEFRMQNQISQIQFHPQAQTDRKTKTILQKIQRKRPQTTGYTTRTKIIQQFN